MELQPNNADAATKLADLYLVAATQGGPQQASLIKEVKELADKMLAQNPKSFDGASDSGAARAVAPRPAGGHRRIRNRESEFNRISLMSCCRTFRR